MCIIYTRPEGIVLPKENFLSAVKNNPHGYGIAIPDGKGNLKVIRRMWDEPDAEGLYSFLHDEAADSQIMLHLRYKTAGDTNLRNIHPFPVLEKSVDGVDMRMSHNGTIHKFKHPLNSKESWESDTRNFVRSYVRPLFKRLILGMEPEDLLTDPFINKILSDLLPATSVLSFIDGFGNTLEVNATGNGGFYHQDGWWCSNKYSFDPSHRTPSTTRHVTHHGNNGASYSRHGRGGSGYAQSWEDDYWNSFGNGSNNGAGQTSQYGYQQPAGFSMDTQQVKFTDKYDIDLSDMLELTDDTLEKISETPDDHLLLTKELLDTCMSLNKANNELKFKLDKASSADSSGLLQANRNQRETIEKMRKDHDELEALYINLQKRVNNDKAA